MRWRILLIYSTCIYKKSLLILTVFNLKMTEKASNNNFDLNSCIETLYKGLNLKENQTLNLIEKVIKFLIINLNSGERII